MISLLYEDAALVVLNKPAGLSSEEGVPAALREQWGKADAFVGAVHRLDTGVSGLMVYAKTPAAAAALSRQITQSQNAYAVQDSRAEGPAESPQFVKRYRAVIAGCPDDALPAAGTLRDYLFKDSRRGRVFPKIAAWRRSPCTPAAPIRSGCSLPPGSIRCGATANTGAAARGTSPCRAAACSSGTRKTGKC